MAGKKRGERDVGSNPTRGAAKTALQDKAVFFLPRTGSKLTHPNVGQPKQNIVELGHMKKTMIALAFAAAIAIPVASRAQVNNQALIQQLLQQVAQLQQILNKLLLENQKKAAPADWKTYESSSDGFSFKYPNYWSEIAETDQYPGSVLRLRMSDGEILAMRVDPITPERNAESIINDVQRLIAGNYRTPQDTPSSEADISLESARYSIRNLVSATGVNIYGYAFVGKHSAVDRYFVFNTGRNKTVQFVISTDLSTGKFGGGTEADAYLLENPDLKLMLESVRIN
ncbi:MAG TPA: hypothetical protein VEB60_02330 [Candidatus Paceibacterota bacterium]|nr:hypothetical protein [Candidatus Paceibacterota bacterium]